MSQILQHDDDKDDTKIIAIPQDFLQDFLRAKNKLVTAS